MYGTIMTTIRSKTIDAAASLVVAGVAGVVGVAIVAVTLGNATGTGPDTGSSAAPVVAVARGRGTLPPLDPPSPGPESIPTIGGGTVVIPPVPSPTVTRPG